MLARCPACSNQRQLLRLCHTACLHLCCVGPLQANEGTFTIKYLACRPSCPPHMVKGAALSRQGLRGAHQYATEKAARQGGSWGQEDFVSIPSSPFQPRERRRLPSPLSSSRVSSSGWRRRQAANGAEVPAWCWGRKECPNQF